MSTVGPTCTPYSCVVKSLTIARIRFIVNWNTSHLETGHAASCSSSRPSTFSTRWSTVRISTTSERSVSSSPSVPGEDLPNEILIIDSRGAIPGTASR